MINLVSGVTGRNYGALGAAFIAANPDKLSVIVRRSSPAGGEVTEDGLRRWGAWLAWFRSIGYKTRYMETRDYWTVPAPWPHEFSSDATVSGDHMAADAYVDIRRREINREADRSAAIKRATVVQGLGYDPRRRPTNSPEAPPTEVRMDSPADLKTPAKPASDELRATMGLPPKPKEKPIDNLEGFVKGFDL